MSRFNFDPRAKRDGSGSGLPEDRYCSDCGFGDYCMRERSCYRRDQGEIRSVEERGDPDPVHDEPLQPHWSESPFWREVFAKEAAAVEGGDPDCGPSRGSTSLTMRGSAGPEQHSGLASAPAAHEARSGLRAQAKTSKAKAQPPRREPGSAASAPPKGGKSHNA